MKWFSQVTCGVILFSCLSEPCFAGIFTYSDESAFLAAVSGEKLESFETYTPTGVKSNQLTLKDFTVNALPAPGQTQPLHSPALEVFLGQDPNINAYPTHGNAWIRYESDVNESIRITFNSPVRSFGLSIVDWGDYAPGSLILSTDAGDAHTVASGIQADGNQIFFGLSNTDTSFSQITLLNQPTLTFFGLDEFYYSTSAVPEPSSLVLLLFGTVVFLLRQRLLAASS